MIDLGTLGGLLEHDHRLVHYCAQCDRWVVLNVAAMIGAGHGERHRPYAVA
jgi:hypothetical protein